MLVGLPYIITSPTGARAVLGNNDVAKADPDWVGYLDPDNGVTISRQIRATSEDLVENDGAEHGDSWHGAASIVMAGILDPNSAPATRDALRRKLRAATLALRADAKVAYTPPNAALRQWWVRRAQDPTFGSRQPTTFQLQFVSERPYALGDESSQIIVPGSAAGEQGFSSPISSPLSSPLNVAGQAFIYNGGELDTWPRFRIMGPITNPRILSNTLGLELRFLVALGAGEFLDVFPPTPHSRVLFGGVTSMYRAVDRAASRWWKLLPGNNDVRLLATAYSAGASVTVYWRPASED